MKFLTSLLDSVRHRAMVRQHIEEEMQPTPQYIILLCLSTIIAHLGIMAGQATVTIGSMILSPLIWPIVGIAVGVVSNKTRMIVTGLATLAGSVLFAVLISFLLTLLFNEQAITLNTEITSRISPTLLDLLIALVIGVAGVLVISWEKISDAAAGVAIAASLLPPLTVTGIGLSLGNMEIAGGSFLLFLTNSSAIVFTGILLFLLLGHHRSDDQQANAVLRLGLITSFISLAVLTIPLTISLTQIFTNNALANTAQKELVQYFETQSNTLSVDSVQVHPTGTGTGAILEVAAVVRADESFRLSYSDASALKNLLQEKLDATVSLDIRTLPLLSGFSDTAQEREQRARENELIAESIALYLEKKDPRIKIDTFKVGAADPMVISLFLLVPTGIEITNDDREKLLQELESATEKSIQLDMSVVRSNEITETIIVPESRVLQSLEATVDAFGARIDPVWQVVLGSREASVAEGIYTLRVILRVPENADSIEPLVNSLRNTLRNRFDGLDEKLRIEVSTQSYRVL